MKLNPLKIISRNIVYAVKFQKFDGLNKPARQMKNNYVAKIFFREIVHICICLWKY
jgi:hypothetical protein